MISELREIRDELEASLKGIKAKRYPVEAGSITLCLTEKDIEKAITNFQKTLTKIRRQHEHRRKTA